MNVPVGVRSPVPVWDDFGGAGRDGNSAQATSGRRKIQMTLTGASKISYLSTDLDGSNLWSGEYVRK